MTDKSLQQSIDELAKLQRASVRISNQFWRPFLNGILAGVGGTAGVAVVLTVSAAALRQAEVIPIVGHWLAQLTPFVQNALHR